MSDEQVGKYIRLLCAQHQKGILSEKDMLIICRTYDKDIFDKFDKVDGGFLNKRLSDETERRKNYSKSRSNNRKGKHINNISKTYVKHMETETINENEIDNTINRALDEIYLEQQKPKWQHIDFDFEVNSFKEKVRGSPDHYRNHDTSGLRLAFQSQLRNAKKKFNGTDKQTANLAANIKAFQDRWADKGQ